MLPELLRMCGRATCPERGIATQAKRCPNCGYVTLPLEQGAADRLRQPERSLSDAPRRRIRSGIPVSTANEIPGWEVTEYIGEVFGLVVRSRGALPQSVAGLMSIFGGELAPMTELLLSTRDQAIERMVEEATARDADGVIAMRFDVTTIGEHWTEVCAYGTAVKATKISAVKSTIES